MGRPKGSKNVVDSGQNTSDSEPEEEEQEQELEAKETPSEVATCNTWRYHEFLEPKIFKEGETIPKGWNKENSRLWYRKTDGIWLKHKK